MTRKIGGGFVALGLAFALGCGGGGGGGSNDGPGPTVTAADYCEVGCGRIGECLGATTGQETCQQACVSAVSQASPAPTSDQLGQAINQVESLSCTDLFPPPPPPPPTPTALLLFGADRNSTFLGCVTCSQFDPDSIWNDAGLHGSPYSSSSIRNPYGTFGGQFGAYSPCNPYLTTTAPILADNVGTYYGRLSINTFGSDSVTNPASRFYGGSAWVQLVNAVCSAF